MYKTLFYSRFFLIILIVVSFCSVVFYQVYFNRHQLEEFRKQVKRRVNNSSPACLLPKINPYHKQALDELEYLAELDCRKKNIATISDGFLIINVDDVTYMHMQYIQRPDEDDFGVQYSSPLLLTDFKKTPIRRGNIGCLVTKNNKILRFDSNDHVTAIETCIPEGFVEIVENGRIMTLKEQCLGVQDDCEGRCPVVLTYDCDDDNTKFRFESNGAIRHSKTGACVQMMSDDYGDYTELILSRDCEKDTSKWHMHHFKDTNVRIELPILEDFIKLVFVKKKEIFLEYHAKVSPKRDTIKEHDSAKQLGLYNVLLIVLESQSAANAVRKMPETYKYLKGDRNTYLFQGHTIVGDGTTDNLCAMLVGQLEKDLPETRRNIDNSGYVDEWPMIFRNFSEAGYVTLFSEDSYDFAAFNYRLNGFKQQPTDHYSRIFWRASKQESDDWRCVGDRPHHRVNLDYTLSLFSSYEHRPKLAMTVLSAISHNNLNNIQYVDKDLTEFMKKMKEKGLLKDTFVFIVGDHGLRTSGFRSSVLGSLEERLPFFSLGIPDKFLKDYSELKKTIQLNTEALTSHFDIHATLFHILNFPRKNSKEIGQSLLTPVSSERTCQSAGVDDHWCPCLRYTEISTKDHLVNQMAKQVVKYINRVKNSTVDSKLKCSELKLMNITYAAVNKHSWEIFKSSKNHDEDEFIDISDIKLNFRNKKPKIYRLVLTVYPSNGIYEISIYKNNKNRIKIDPNISRLNLYGDQPSCIAKKYPHLRKFCFCKRF